MPFEIFDAHCDTLDRLLEEDNLKNCPYHFNFNKAERYDSFTQVMDIWIDK